MGSRLAVAAVIHHGEVNPIRWLDHEANAHPRLQPEQVPNWRWDGGLALFLNRDGVALHAGSF
jgi:hypothetical protein